MLNRRLINSVCGVFAAGLAAGERIETKDLKLWESKWRFVYFLFESFGASISYFVSFEQNIYDQTIIFWKSHVFKEKFRFIFQRKWTPHFYFETFIWRLVIAMVIGCFSTHQQRAMEINTWAWPHRSTDQMCVARKKEQQFTLLTAAAPSPPPAAAAAVTFLFARIRIFVHNIIFAIYLSLIVCASFHVLFRQNIDRTTHS